LSDAVSTIASTHGMDESEVKGYPDYLKSKIVAVCTALRRLSIEVDDFELNFMRDGWERITEEEIDKRLARLAEMNKTSELEEVEGKMEQLTIAMDQYREEHDRLKRRQREGPGCDN